MTKPIFYLATPYSKYCQGREAAYRHACDAAARLLKRGTLVFSPVAHSHPIAEIGGIDPLCHNTWMMLDLAILSRFDGLIVLMMPGWNESAGVAAEIERANELGMPISYLSWPMLYERENVESSGYLQPRG